MKRGWMLVALAGCHATPQPPPTAPPSREASLAPTTPAAVAGALVPVPASVEQVQRDGSGDPATRLRVHTDAVSRHERTLAEHPPTPSPDGSWRAPTGAAITERFVVGWSAPRELEGQPLTALYARDTATYWVQQSGGLSTDVTWYGPFSLATAPGARP